MRKISRRSVIAGAATAFTTSAFANETELAFLVVGDWGEANGAQHAVASAMGHVASDIHSAFVVSTGDNFYGRGVRSIEDPQWRTTFEEVYAAPSLQTPWYSVLGNHDYEGSPGAELAYTNASDRWRMPARYWRQDMIAPGGAEAAFFFLDTTPITRLSALRDRIPGVDREAHAELQWLERELAACRSPWKIVVGHHPILSSGAHGASPQVAAHVRPLLERYGVRVYFNGHDHDLEHLSANGLDYICSGSGSEARVVRAVPESRFACACPGFAACRLEASALNLRFHDASGALLYETSIAR
jgi:acid phosphatase